MSLRRAYTPSRVVSKLNGVPRRRGREVAIPRDQRVLGIAVSALHALAHLGDVAPDLMARREGTRRLELVFVGDDQRVGKVYARCTDGDADLALAQRLGGQIHQLQAFRPARCFAQHRAHVTLPSWCFVLWRH